MRPPTTSLRPILVGSPWQAKLMTTMRPAPPPSGFQPIRAFHPSPFPRRAPVPNATARPTGTLGTSSSTSTAGSTLGAGSTSGTRNGTGSTAGAKRPNPHKMWYREIVPGERITCQLSREIKTESGIAMIPPLLLSLTIFLSLSLLRLHLSHQLSLSEQQAQIELLERELERLRRDTIRRAEREKRERERMLPVLVGKVLARVGVMAGDKDVDEEPEEESPRLLV